MVRRKLSGIRLAVCIIVILMAPLAHTDEPMHMGVASCASSVCHGRTTISAHNRVWMTEFRVWQDSDPHAGAYDTLLSEQSRRIAARLRIGNPAEAKVCLDCHADNVPAERRGERFDLTDGVGCEACHGGAEDWLSSHADRKATHDDNLHRGMYPTSDPVARGQLCLGCHLGNPGQFASHDIMAAGHPQLLFELASYSPLQPMHYAIDDDYVERKGPQDPIDLWLHGISASASMTLTTISRQTWNGDAVFPEVALYQCDSCHRETSKARGTAKGFAATLPSGSIPLNDTALRLLVTVARAMDIEGATTASARVDALAYAAVTQRSRLPATAAALAPWLDTVSSAMLSKMRSRAQLASIRRGLLEFAARGDALYFPLAAQVYLGVANVNTALGELPATDTRMQQWFATVATEASFDPAGFELQGKRLFDEFR